MGLFRICWLFLWWGGCHSRSALGGWVGDDDLGSFFVLLLLLYDFKDLSGRPLLPAHVWSSSSNFWSSACGRYILPGRSLSSSFWQRLFKISNLRPLQHCYQRLLASFVRVLLFCCFFCSTRKRFS